MTAVERIDYLLNEIGNLAAQTRNPEDDPACQHIREHLIRMKAREIEYEAWLSRVLEKKSSSMKERP